MVISVLWLVLLAGASLASLGAGTDIEKGNMLLKFVEVVDAMAYAAAGLCLICRRLGRVACSWPRGPKRGARGRARSAVALAITGLVLTLSAKGIALALLKVTPAAP